MENTSATKGTEMTTQTRDAGTAHTAECTLFSDHPGECRTLTARPFADLEATWAKYTNDLLDGRRCKNCGSAGHTFCNR